MNHGSAVTKIIDNYVQESTIISVQVFNDNHMIRARDLASSIKKSINEFHPDIINIIMGTRSDSDGELQQAVNYAVKKKVVLVCAADNSGAISYPAFYKDTLSVLCDYKIKQIKNFNVVYNNWIDILAYSGHFSVEIKKRQEQVIGSSFSTPVITAIINNMWSKDLVGQDNLIVEIKKEMSQMQYSNDSFHLKHHHNIVNDFLTSKDKAIFLPLNKEVFALMNNSDFVVPHIASIYDYHTSPKIGKSMADIGYTSYVPNQVIGDMRDINWESNDFNSVVLGHVKEISLLLKKDLLSEIIEKCNEYNKKIYALDLVQNEKKLYKERLGGSLFTFNTPIVGVIGTSSKQGKVSLQLEITRLLKKVGYDVGLMLTEPFSEIIGCKHYWHYGYNASKFSWQEHVVGSNNTMKKIDDEKHDLIIAGTQSQVMSSNMKNTGFIPVETQSVLTGINADCYVLLVNKTDSTNLITRIVKYIESYYNRPVLALVESRGTSELKGNLNDLPIFCLSETDKVVKRIIEFF